MDLLKGCFEGENPLFIDEHRLLCIVEERKLSLWDFTVENESRNFTFLMKPSIHRIASIMRSYELFDTQPFRVDPEAGVVILGIVDSTKNYRFVIPVKTFLSHKKRGFWGRTRDGNSKGEIQWKMWSHFTTEMKPLLPLQSSFFSFHTHTLSISPYRVDEQHTSIYLLVDDFSLYSRRNPKDPEDIYELQTLNKHYRTQTSSDRPLPPVVSNLLVIKLDTSEIPYDHHGIYPTENGVLVVKVRISVVPRRIRVLTRFTFQPGEKIGRLFGVRPIRPIEIAPYVYPTVEGLDDV